MNLSRRARAATLLILLVGAGARASERSDDLKARRARLMDRLGADAMLVVWSAVPARYSLDLDYENPLDRTPVHQRWTRDDQRWSVMSRTETTWSFRRR